MRWLVASLKASWVDSAWHAHSLHCMHFHRVILECMTQHLVCRQRRITAVQSQFGLAHTADSDHSSDTDAAELHSACSESAADSAAFETPYTSPQPVLEEDSSEWETVPVKPKREAPPGSAAPSPDGWVEEASGSQTGQWEIPNKHTKLSHQPESSPAPASAIRAMHTGDPTSGDESVSDSRQQQPSNRGRGRGRGKERGRGQNRGRGRGRNGSADGRRHRDQSRQHQKSNSRCEAGSTAQQQQSGEGEVASSWGAETVFPMSPSPLTHSPVDSPKTVNSAPKVLTVPRQPQTRSMSSGSTGQQPQLAQQRGRGNRGLHNGRGSNRSERSSGGRQKGQAAYVQSGPVYHKPEQPASQNFSFGSFGAEDFGSAFDASKSGAAAVISNNNGNQSAHMYQDMNDQVQKQPPSRGAYRGRGRGRGQVRSRGQGRSGNFGNTRQGDHVDIPTSVA